MAMLTLLTKAPHHAGRRRSTSRRKMRREGRRTAGARSSVPSFDTPRVRWAIRTARTCTRVLGVEWCVVSPMLSTGYAASGMAFLAMHAAMCQKCGFLRLLHGPLLSLHRLVGFPVACSCGLRRRGAARGRLSARFSPPSAAARTGQSVETPSPRKKKVIRSSAVWCTSRSDLCILTLPVIMNNVYLVRTFILS